MSCGHLKSSTRICRLMKDMRYYPIIIAKFKEVHPNHYAVPNGECPFYPFKDFYMCPFYASILE